MSQWLRSVKIYSNNNYSSLVWQKKVRMFENNTCTRQKSQRFLLIRSIDLTHNTGDGSEETTCTSFRQSNMIDQKLCTQTAINILLSNPQFKTNPVKQWKKDRNTMTNSIIINIRNIPDIEPLATVCFSIFHPINLTKSFETKDPEVRT